MADPAVFESRAAQIAKSVETQVAALRAQGVIGLAERGSPLVKTFVEKIEGTYNVARAKVDTDNAIDLLYIAYNTTPQEEGEVRVKIAAIMDKMIRAQGDSAIAMGEAMRAADNVLVDMDSMLPDWLDAKASGEAGDIRAFVVSDLLELANDIKVRAMGVQTKLLAIAKAYDGIIAETAAASSVSEQALGRRLHDQQVVQDEINEANAEREQLDSLVKDLQDEVAKFEAKARQYEQRANTAEERAFVMSIIKVGAQMVAAALPPIAMAAGAAATGGMSVVAAGAASAVSQVTNPKPAAAADPTADAIKTKTDISQKKKELEVVQQKTEESKAKVVELRGELRKAQAGGVTDAETPKETLPQPTDSQEVVGVKERLKDAQLQREANEQKAAALVGVLAGLQASASALAQGLGELSQEQKDSAGSLREIQMKMLDKAEAYERERRDQAARLVKINALLKGKLTKDETIKLAVKSLNISIAALKRTKEIVQEIAFFFRSFADFMEQIVEEAKIEIGLVDNVAGKTVLGKNRLEHVIRTTDEFFIRQSAEWRAVNVVSDLFNRSFSDGRSKLNRLAGTYITGAELAAYLQTAAVLLKSIADAREDAAKARLVDLEQYRVMLRADATREDVA